MDDPTFTPTQFSFDARLPASQLTTFEPKQSKQRACNAKAQKGVDWELELELEKWKEMCRERHQ